MAGLALCIGLGAVYLNFKPATSSPPQNQTSDVRYLAVENEGKTNIGKGFDKLLQPGEITIFGEIHGTREVPRLISNLVTSVKNTPVVVGLEIPDIMTATLTTFMNSDGTPDDVAKLLTHRFWEYRDGRASKAMLQLLVDLRKLRSEGRIIDVFAFDHTSDPDPRARDQGMASNIIKKLTTIEIEKTITFIIAGNMHARIDNQRWMAWHVRNQFPKMVSLNNAYSGGTAWVCTDKGCGPTTMAGIDRGTDQFVERNTSQTERWQGIFYLGSISASPPVHDENESLFLE